MLSGGITLLTAAGTFYTAYEAYHQDVSVRSIVMLSVTGGLVFSIFLQSLAGRFSKSETSLGTKIVRVLVKDFSSILSSVILPVTVAYGYGKRLRHLIEQKSYGFIQINQAITIRGQDVAHLYPVLVGANLGFLAGQTIGRVFSHFFKA